MLLVLLSTGIDVIIDDDDKENWSVLVVTPIMKRTQKLAAAGEIVFIDSTSSCESTQSSITPILIATKGGAVPIGILVHCAQSTECYERGFRLLQNNFPRCFGGKSVRSTACYLHETERNVCCQYRIRNLIL